MRRFFESFRVLGEDGGDGGGDFVKRLDVMVMDVDVAADDEEAAIIVGATYSNG